MLSEVPIPSEDFGGSELSIGRRPAESAADSVLAEWEAADSSGDFGLLLAFVVPFVEFGGKSDGEAVDELPFSPAASDSLVLDCNFPQLLNPTKSGNMRTLTNATLFKIRHETKRCLSIRTV